MHPNKLSSSVMLLFLFLYDSWRLRPDVLAWQPPCRMLTGRKLGSRGQSLSIPQMGSAQSRQVTSPRTPAAPTESPPTQDSRHSGQGCLCHSAASELGSWVCASDGVGSPWLAPAGLASCIGASATSSGSPCWQDQKRAQRDCPVSKTAGGSRGGSRGGARGGRYHHHCPQPCSLKVNIPSSLRVFWSSFHPHHSNRRGLGPSYS